MPNAAQEAYGAAKRLQDTRSKVAALRSELTNVEQRFGDQLLADADVTALREKRERITSDLGDLAIVIRKLERLCDVEEGQQLIEDAQQARARHNEMQQQIERQKQVADDAAKALHDASAELYRLKNVGTSVFERDLRIRRFREAHPDIPLEVS